MRAGRGFNPLPERRGLGEKIHHPPQALQFLHTRSSAAAILRDRRQLPLTSKAEQC